MRDNAGNNIGSTHIDSTKNPIGDPINAKDPLSFASKLTNPLIVTGEHQNDYIQFSLGALSWTSRDTTGPAHCKNGGWDPRQGPVCGQLIGSDIDAVLSLLCSTLCCPWEMSMDWCSNTNFCPLLDDRGINWTAGFRARAPCNCGSEVWLVAFSFALFGDDVIRMKMMYRPIPDC